MFHLANLSLPMHLKGLDHHKGNFLRSIKLHQYFPYMRQCFLQLFSWPVEENIT
jgi:hypothetical protein